jgi:hypothetical protein
MRPTARQCVVRHRARAEDEVAAALVMGCLFIKAVAGLASTVVLKRPGSSTFSSPRQDDEKVTAPAVPKLWGGATHRISLHSLRFTFEHFETGQWEADDAGPDPGWPRFLEQCGRCR